MVIPWSYVMEDFTYIFPCFPLWNMLLEVLFVFCCFFFFLFTALGNKLSYLFQDIQHRYNFSCSLCTPLLFALLWLTVLCNSMFIFQHGIALLLRLQTILCTAECSTSYFTLSPCYFSCMPCILFVPISVNVSLFPYLVLMHSSSFIVMCL